MTPFTPRFLTDGEFVTRTAPERHPDDVVVHVRRAVSRGPAVDDGVD